MEETLPCLELEPCLGRKGVTECWGRTGGGTVKSMAGGGACSCTGAEEWETKNLRDPLESP